MKKIYHWLFKPNQLLKMINPQGVTNLNFSFRQFSHALILFLVTLIACPTPMLANDQFLGSADNQPGPVVNAGSAENNSTNQNVVAPPNLAEPGPLSPPTLMAGEVDVDVQFSGDTVSVYSTQGHFNNFTGIYNAANGVAISAEGNQIYFNDDMQVVSMRNPDTLWNYQTIEDRVFLTSMTRYTSDGEYRVYQAYNQHGALTHKITASYNNFGFSRDTAWAEYETFDPQNLTSVRASSAVSSDNARSYFDSIDSISKGSIIDNLASTATAYQYSDLESLGDFSRRSYAGDLAPLNFVRPPVENLNFENAVAGGGLTGSQGPAEGTGGEFNSGLTLGSSDLIGMGASALNEAGQGLMSVGLTGDGIALNLPDNSGQNFPETLFPNILNLSADAERQLVLPIMKLNIAIDDKNAIALDLERLTGLLIQMPSTRDLTSVEFKTYLQFLQETIARLVALAEKYKDDQEVQKAIQTALMNMIDHLLKQAQVKQISIENIESDLALFGELLDREATNFALTPEEIKVLDQNIDATLKILRQGATQEKTTALRRAIYRSWYRTLAKKVRKIRLQRIHDLNFHTAQPNGQVQPEGNKAQTPK